METLKTLSDKKESFDVIFMDADKDNYGNYYKVIQLAISNSSAID